MKHRRHITPLCAAALASLLCAGCHNDTLYHSFATLPGEEWRQGDTLFFTLPPCETDEEVQLTLQLRCTAHYPHKTLHLTLIDNLADSTRFQGEKMECAIYNDEGEQQGSSAGCLFQSSFAVGRRHRQPARTATVKVVHNMADPLLRGVADVGIKTERCAQRQSAAK